MGFSLDLNSTAIFVYVVVVVVVFSVVDSQHTNTDSSHRHTRNYLKRHKWNNIDGIYNQNAMKNVTFNLEMSKWSVYQIEMEMRDVQSDFF